MESTLLSDLSQLGARHADRLRVRSSVPGRDVTTFALGGELSILAEPQDIESLGELIDYLRRHSVPWRVLGAGSNVVVSDEGVGEVIIRLGSGFQGGAWVGSTPGELSLPESLPTLPDFEHRMRGSGLLLVYGSASLMALSRKSCAAGLSGLEFAAGIPASVGGAAVMNAGAHGKSFSDCCQAVVVVTESGGVDIIPAAQIGFSYRETKLPVHCVVIGALLALHEGDRGAIREERTRCLDYRKQTQPLHLPSAGSVFANPGTEVAAASLIEECGYKGYRLGGVMVSEMHSNWIVRVSEQGRAAEVRAIVDEIRDEVYSRRDIMLRPEIRFWGAEMLDSEGTV